MSIKTKESEAFPYRAMNRFTFLVFKHSIIGFVLVTIILGLAEALDLSGNTLAEIVLISSVATIIQSFMDGFFEAAWKDLKNLSWRKR
jgi:ABC-type uncharacterized transport system permease subunit